MRIEPFVGRRGCIAVPKRVIATAPTERTAVTVANGLAAALGAFLDAASSVKVDAEPFVAGVRCCPCRSL